MNSIQKILYIKNPLNYGVSAGFNQGIKIALIQKSEFFLIVNNDIIFRKDSIDNLLKFARNTNYGYVTSIDSRRCFKQDYLEFKLRNEEWEGLCNSCFILKKSTVDKIGFYDENYFPAYMEDIDYIERMGQAGIERRSTFMSIIFHDEGSTGRKNNWKLTSECNSSAKLYEFAYIKGKEYFKKKWGFCPN